jgi:hypothetical protein
VLRPHPRLVGIEENPEAKREAEEALGKLFGNNRNGDLDIRYSAHPNKRA